MNAVQGLRGVLDTLEMRLVRARAAALHCLAVSTPCFAGGLITCSLSAHYCLPVSNPRYMSDQTTGSRYAHAGGGAAERFRDLTEKGNQAKKLMQ